MPLWSGHIFSEFCCFFYEIFPIPHLSLFSRTNQLRKSSASSVGTSFQKEACIPRQLFRIPEFFLGLLSITIHILSEERDFFGSTQNDFLYLCNDLILSSTHFPSASVWDDTEGTVVIATCLDDDIGTCRILLELFDLEIFVKFGIIPYFLS